MATPHEVAIKVFRAPYQTARDRVCSGHPDDAFYLEMITEFFGSMATRLQSSDAAIDAIEAGNATFTTKTGVTQAPATHLRNVVHGIKGTTGNLHLMTLHLVAKAAQHKMDDAPGGLATIRWFLDVRGGRGGGPAGAGHPGTPPALLNHLDVPPKSVIFIFVLGRHDSLLVRHARLGRV